MLDLYTLINKQSQILGSTVLVRRRLIKSVIFCWFPQQ